MSLTCSHLYTHATLAHIVNTTSTCNYTMLDALVLLVLQDKTCILWDANKWLFIRQLRSHNSPVSVVTINQLSVSQCNMLLFLFLLFTVLPLLIRHWSLYHMKVSFIDLFFLFMKTVAICTVGKHCLLHSEWNSAVDREWGFACQVWNSHHRKFPTTLLCCIRG